MKIKIKYKKLLLKLRKRKEEKFFQSLDDNQKLSYNITRYLINDKEATLTIAPLSNTYYIRKKEVFVKIDFKSVIIVEGKIKYEVYLPDVIIEKLRSKFCHVAELRRITVERDIMENIKTGLQHVFDTLEEKKIYDD